MSEGCVCCGKPDSDLRLGICFDCASEGENRAAHRTVLGHLGKAAWNAWNGHWHNIRFDLRWAWERLTRTGDYAPGGYFQAQCGVRLK